MKIGILCAIDPDKSVVNWGGSPVDAYIRFLERENPAFSYQSYMVALGEFPETAESCDAYVITGSPQGVYDEDPWIDPLLAFIREGYAKEKKFVGICFGHQALAEALGGKVIKSEKGWGMGLDQIDLTESAEWMDGDASSLSLYFAHQDQVIDLPPQARWLGGNNFCPYGMYEIDGRVFSVQGHPEFNTRIMESIIDYAKTGSDPARAKAAENALLAQGEQPSGNDLMARWIVGFLKR